MNKLRCQAGDIAIVTKSVCGNEGKIVKILYALDVGNQCHKGGTFICPDFLVWYKEYSGFLWYVEGLGSSLNIPNGKIIRRPMYDDNLFPITDTEELIAVDTSPGDYEQ